jgi:hypothetical protein
MAITVKHKFVSTIPDGDDASVVRPSNWNDTHELTGLGTMAEQNANSVAITGGTISGVSVSGYVPTTETITAGTGLTGGGDLSANRTIALANTAVTTGTYGNAARTITQTVDQQGRLTNIFDQPIAIANTQVSGLGTASTKDAGVANGVATLDGSGTVPISQLPSAVLGALSYQGTWNASTNTPTLTSSVGTKGYYYVVDVAGSTNLNGITDWKVGDWAVFNGSIWQKIDNTDAVTSVNGYTGTVVLTNTDISGFGTMSTQNANSVAITGGAINGTTIGATAQADITGNTIAAFTKFVATDYYAQSITGGNLRTSSGSSLLNWDGGGSGNVSVNGGLTASPSNKNVTLSPTGTGTVTVNPATTGAMDNMVIGATTPKAITGTTITATTFSGSGASLTSIPNSALVNSTITINGNSTALGGSVSVGTVTSVGATGGTGISVSGSPITGSGSLTITNTAPDQTVVLNNGTGISVTGTYPNFTVTNTAPSSGGTVTSVSGTTGRITSTGGTTPVIDLASGIATAGTTGSSTLIPVVTIDTYGRVTSITTASNPQGTVTSVTATSPVTSTGGATPVIAMPAATTSVNGYLTSTDWNTFNGKAPSVTYTTNYIPYGQGTTTPNQSSGLQYDGTSLTSGNIIGTAGLYAKSTMSATYTDGLVADYLTGNGRISVGSADTLSFYNGGVANTLLGQFGTDKTFTAAQVNASNGIVVNSKTIAASYSIPSGSNAMSAGPVTVASGQSVTVASGSRWVVL